MSEESSLKDIIGTLPHIKENHLAVLRERGLDAPDKLLSALKDEEKWKELHPLLKGIGPKTRDAWIKILEESIPAKPAVRKKLQRKLKKPVEVAKPPEEREPPKKIPKVEKEKEPEKEAVEEAEEELEEVEELEEAEEEEEEEEEGEVEIVEEGEYVPKQKAKLSEKLMIALNRRKEISSSRPKFLRQEYHRYARVRTGWRKPKGRHSKARRRMKYRQKVVTAGFGSPKDVRGLHSSGFEEVKVFNVNDLEKISDPERQAARIGHTVGQRKRELIIDRADELGIRILNRG